MRAEAQFLVRDAIDAEDLGRLRLFANADIDAVADVLSDCAISNLSRGEVVLAPGDTNQTLFLVVHGRLRVHLGSLDGDAVQWVQDGDAVGEISLIDEKPVTAYVVADMPTTVLEIDQAKFWSLVDASHAVARNMLVMVVERMRANNALVAEGMRLREDYNHQTNVDELTGLRNRRAIEELLRRQLLRSSMNHKPLAVMMVEIDEFDRFHREFGREARDHALFAVAQTLQEQVRPTDIVGRMEGDKFIILLPDCDDNGAAVVASRLREGVAETVVAMGDQSILPSVTISLGLAPMRGFERAEELLEEANHALMRAISAGRNEFSA